MHYVLFSLGIGIVLLAIIGYTLAMMWLAGMPTHTTTIAESCQDISDTTYCAIIKKRAYIIAAPSYHLFVGRKENPYGHRISLPAGTINSYSITWESNQLRVTSSQGHDIVVPESLYLGGR
jgi:uncharacterized protein YpmB